MSSPEFNAYSEAVAALLDPPRLNELGPGSPNRAAQDQLDALTPEQIVAPHAVADPSMASACCAGLWLWHDFLDESHTISQAIPSPTGSFWHGIMHRREPDAGNSKYWFRKVGDHPIFDELCQTARELAGAEQDAGRLDSAARFLADQQQWEPFAWIDLCDAARRGLNACEMLCRQIQQHEWRLLFDFCYRRAGGLN